MERAYRILSVQGLSRAGEKVIYTLLEVGQNSLRIKIERRLTWEVGDMIVLDDLYVAENKIHD